MKWYQMRWAQKYWGKEARECYRRYLQSDTWKTKRQVRFTNRRIPMPSMWCPRNGGSPRDLQADLQRADVRFNGTLIATFTSDDPLRSTAIVKNTATGAEKTVHIGDTIAEYSVLDIQAKQILIEKAGEPAIWKRMNHFLLY